MGDSEDNSEVVRIAGEVSDAEDSKIPNLLLQLKELLDQYPEDSKGLRVVRRTIWKYDLLSWCAICLSYDYAKIKGGLQTAATIANVLCDCCCFIDVTESQEFSQSTLPAAVQSCLKLLRQFQQHIVDSIKPPSTQLKPDAQLAGEIFSQLRQLISTHPHLCTSMLNSKDLLRLMMEDDLGKDFVLNTISLIRRAIRVNKHSIQQITKTNMQLLLDELVYKLTASSDDDLAHASTSLIITLTESHHPILNILVTRFKGLKAVLGRWSDHGFDRDLELLMSLLETGSVENVLISKQKKAANTIWAYYIGWKTRTRMNKLKQSLPKLQQSFRRKRSERKSEEEQRKWEEQEKVEMKLERKRSFRKSKEKHLHALEILPADQINQHIRAQEREAATRIQAHWRAHMQRKVFIEEKRQKKKSVAAVVIQRAYRNSSKRDTSRSKPTPPPPALEVRSKISEERREELKTKIEHWQAIHKRIGVSHEVASANHKRAQEMLLEYRCRELKGNSGKQKVDVVLARIHTQLQTLNDLPSLDAASRADIANLSCNAQVTQNAALMEHNKQLRFVDLPWWKRLGDNADDVTWDGW
uniref:IQ calmodulin-binding motif-containing protein 1 n=1 Tax=Phallusia mammillata TaxID=59560 RepID=A0A6F9DEL3_9ASCI|nr:IQ calmodulin-binding motif-containing protein 1 [Phallusia mammillata]